MNLRTPPFDYARASALMDEQDVEASLVCSRANVGYLADHTCAIAAWVMAASPSSLPRSCKRMLRCDGRLDLEFAAAICTDSRARRWSNADSNCSRHTRATASGVTFTSRHFLARTAMPDASR